MADSSNAATMPTFLQSEVVLRLPSVMYDPCRKGIGMRDRLFFSCQNSGCNVEIKIHSCIDLLLCFSDSEISCKVDYTH